MGRTPQPREIALLKGAHKKHPERYRGITPKNDAPLSNPSSHLKPSEKKWWRIIQANSLPGVLTESDRFLFETMVKLYAEYQADKEKKFPAAKLNVMIGLFARYGYSPSDRQKFNTAPPGETEKNFDDL